MEHFFTNNDQKIFAEFSGDYNPVHIDNVRARRFAFGEIIVHGINSFLWAIDHWLSSKNGFIELLSVNVVFGEPIFIEEVILYKVAEEKDDFVEIHLIGSGAIKSKIKVFWRFSKPVENEFNFSNILEKKDSKLINAELIANCSGSLNLNLNKEYAKKLFPNLLTKIDNFQFADLLLTSRLVGMECPGYNSIFSELTFQYKTSDEISYEIGYSVEKFDKRFSLIIIQVDSKRLTGTIKALLRPEIKKQESYLNIKNMVGRGEFIGQNALVLGGSRGLGEVAAKILAAGGANVVLTYYKGADDAQNIIDEIISDGGNAKCVHFDILDPDQQIADEVNSFCTPTHLYYFATPKIGTSKKGTFSIDKFMKFSEYYLDGFYKTVLKFDKTSLKNIFYPSTIFIDEKPSNMSEYVVSKVAGEYLCKFIKENIHNYIIHQPRLKKLDTDQTAGFTMNRAEAPLSTIVTELRAFNEMSI